MPHFSENSYVFVVFDFREMGLRSGITLVYPVFTYGRNLRKEIKISEILILKSVVSGISPQEVGAMCHIPREQRARLPFLR